MVIAILTVIIGAITILGAAHLAISQYRSPRTKLQATLVG